MRRSALLQIRLHDSWPCDIASPQRVQNDVIVSPRWLTTDMALHLQSIFFHDSTTNEVNKARFDERGSEADEDNGSEDLSCARR
jgi:hypothetical protein